MNPIDGPEMDPALNKKRLDKLARVRENQRRSRARRQDHIRDLEQKVLTLQQELDRRDIERRLAVQRLEAENKRLKDLLSSSGVPPDALEAYLRRVDNPVMAQKVAIPGLPRPLVETRLQCEETKSMACARKPTDDEIPPSDYPEHTVARTTDHKSTDLGIVLQAGKGEKSQEPEIHPFCACPPGEDMEALPISERVLNTTFCAVAEQLVDQYNTRGVDSSEIRQKLREGFFRGLAEEGCRVQNQILFQVLDEISNH